jgi:transcriptional regulator with XRE-family HTH domain
MRYDRALRIIRAVRGLSQKDLARRVHVDPSFISLIEAGEREPSTATIGSLAKALRVPVYLLTLLASESHDTRGITSEQAESLGRHLLEVLLEAEKGV